MLIANYVEGHVDLESFNDLIKVMEPPYPMALGQFGPQMMCRDFDGVMPGLTLGAAALRHANADWNQENTAGRAKSQVFKETVCALFGALQDSVHYPNLLKALNFDFFDDSGEVLTHPKWTVFADPMNDPLDGQGIYLSETLRGQLKPSDPLSKALTLTSAPEVLLQEEK